MIELVVKNAANIQQSELLLKVSFSDIISDNPLLVVNFDSGNLIQTGNVYLTNKIGTFDKLVALNKPSILVDEFVPLDEGDIVFIQLISTKAYLVYQTKSSHNVLFLTGNCNSMCRMCPQPPRKDEIDYFSIAKKTIELIDNNPTFMSISGGEPTLLGNKLFEIISILYEKWSSLECQLLTNARALSNAEYTKNLMDVCEGKKISFGIPLHSDILEIHDDITQRKGSFAQTIRGLYNLSLYNVPIELRIVAQKANIERLGEMVLFIGRYLTFVNHISIMQMEPEGFAREHWNDFWVDPVDYQKAISDAVKNAKRIGIPIRLFNYQLCVLPYEVRDYACQSISDWKNIYQKGCLMCPRKFDCAGFFKSQKSQEYYSKFISPI